MYFFSQYLNLSFCQSGNTFEALLYIKFFLGYQGILYSWESGDYTLLDTVAGVAVIMCGREDRSWCNWCDISQSAGGTILPPYFLLNACPFLVSLCLLFASLKCLYSF